MSRTKSNNKTSKNYSSNQPFDPCGKICVVTGASSGIGAALCLALAQAGASAVIVSDLYENAEFQKLLMLQGAKQSLFVRANAAIELDIVALIDQVENSVGPIDLFIVNAGVVSSDDGEEMTGKTTLEGIFPEQNEWDKVMGVNLNQGIFVAKHLIPRYLKRGKGHIMITSSAAGLLMQVGSITYTISKAAALSLAEWLSVTYGSRGISVSCLCPQYVRTNMTHIGHNGDSSSSQNKYNEINDTHQVDRDLIARSKRILFGFSRTIEPEEVAKCCMESLKDGKFLILPHGEVAVAIRKKAFDRDRWLCNMRNLSDKYTSLVAQHQQHVKPPRSKL